MSNGPRTPPRFVPTLTTVFEAVPETVPQPEAEPPAPAAARARAADAGLPPAYAHAVALTPEVRVSEAEALRLEEQLLHRVLQRVDLSLEERVSDAVSAAVQQHLDRMIPGLRAEIESVLRDLVSEALARELTENPGSVPALGRESLG